MANISIEALNEKINEIDMKAKELQEKRLEFIDHKKKIHAEATSRIDLINNKIERIEDRYAKLQQVKMSIQADIAKL